MYSKILKPVCWSLMLMLLATAAIRIGAQLQPVHLSNQPPFDARYFSDRYGKSLGVILSQDQEHTIHVALSEISPYFVQAIISAEDSRFYQHGGVDFRALLRALREHASRSGTRSGASTITMQLARMLDPKPRTVVSKLREMYQAWRMEAGMSKAEILYAYLNRLPMGGNLYGVEAASRYYFGSGAHALDLAQATLLAAIPNDPNYLQPHTHFSSVRKRQRYILARLQHSLAIDPLMRRQAWQETLSLRDPSQKLLAPHLLMRLQQTEPHSANTLQTTLDLDLQQFVEQQIRHTLHYLSSVHDAAVLVVNNKNGEVLAYAGSPDFYAKNGGMNDGVQARRQTGSTLKPFLYEYAFEHDIVKPSGILADIPTQWDLGEQPGQYAPQDYSKAFLGPVRASMALANSLNVPAVRLLEKVSVPVFQTHLQDLGFSFPHRAAYYGLGLVLGDAEATLEQMTRAYLGFARSGDALSLKFMRAKNGKPMSVVEQRKTIGEARYWQLTAQVLADPYLRAQSFGVDSILRLPFPVAVKTGTSSHYRDNWTLGFSSDFTVGVWVGNFDGSPMGNISGVVGAAPLFARIMLHLHENTPPADLPMPAGFTKIQVCPLSGKKPGQHCPHGALDFIETDQLAKFNVEPCDWHQANDAAVLPALYRDWAQRHDVNVAQSGELHIIHPGNGSRYVLSETIPVMQQKIELKAAGMHENLEWRMDGKILAGNSDQILWPMQSGKHLLQVSNRQGQNASTAFEVTGQDDADNGLQVNQSESFYPLALH